MKNSVNSLVERVKQDKEMDEEKESLRILMIGEDERTQNEETRTNSVRKFFVKLSCDSK